MRDRVHADALDGDDGLDAVSVMYEAPYRPVDSASFSTKFVSQRLFTPTVCGCVPTCVCGVRVYMREFVPMRACVCVCVRVSARVKYEQHSAIYACPK